MTEHSAPLISIVIPAYNDQAGLDACLLAIMHQQAPPGTFEVVVVDNASTPGLHLPPAFAAMARMVVCATPGSYAARNLGAGVARGRILAFVDADCVAEADWLRNGADFLTGHGRGVVVGGEVTVTAPPCWSPTGMYQHLVGFEQRKNVEERGFSVTANLWCFRDDFHLVGPFDEQLLSGGDLEWSRRAHAAGMRLEYAASSRVSTRPRMSLASAIRQARRVAGGREVLQRLDYAHVPAASTASHRRPASAVLWILRQSQVSWLDRIQVLAVASLIKAATLVEVIRLRMGGQAERR